MNIVKHIKEHEVLGIRPLTQLSENKYIQNCSSSTLVGDIVYINKLTQQVEPFISNKQDYIPYGIIILKYTDTKCLVQTYGLCDLSFTIDNNKNYVFIGLDGKLTSDVPTDGYFNKIGNILGNNKIYINIDTRIKRTPF